MRQTTVDDVIAAFHNSLYSEETPGASLQKDDFMESLVRGTIPLVPELDSHIARHSEHWRLDRMSTVDRNILRLALYELRTNANPPAVVIDEAIELARRFSGEESVKFINGVLDALRKEIDAAPGEIGNQSGAAQA
jgi:N utilization substance protein B